LKRKNNTSTSMDMWARASELLCLADELQQEKNELIALTEEIRRLVPFSNEGVEIVIQHILEFTYNMDLAYEIITEFATEIQPVEDDYTTLYAPPSFVL